MTESVPQEEYLGDKTELGEALESINRDDRKKKLSKISRDQHGALLSLLCLNHLNVLPSEIFNIGDEFLETSISVEGLAREQHTNMVAGHQDTKKNNIFTGMVQRQQ